MEISDRQKENGMQKERALSIYYIMSRTQKEKWITPYVKEYLSLSFTD